MQDNIGSIRISIPPSDGFKDIAVIGSQQLEGQGELVTNYIQSANSYLRFTITIVAFAALAYTWLQLMGNPLWSDNRKTALKNMIFGAWIALVIVMMSYTIVRIVINLI